MLIADWSMELNAVDQASLPQLLLALSRMACWHVQTAVLSLVLQLALPSKSQCDFGRLRRFIYVSFHAIGIV